MRSISRCWSGVKPKSKAVVLIRILAEWIHHEKHKGHEGLRINSPKFVIFVFFVVKFRFSDYLYSSLMKPDLSNSATNELSMNCSGLVVLALGLMAKSNTACIAAVET